MIEPLLVELDLPMNTLKVINCIGALCLLDFLFHNETFRVKRNQSNSYVNSCKLQWYFIFEPNHQYVHLIIESDENKKFGFFQWSFNNYWKTEIPTTFVTICFFGKIFFFVSFKIVRKFYDFIDLDAWSCVFKCSFRCDLMIDMSTTSFKYSYSTRYGRFIKDSLHVRKCCSKSI